MTDLQKAKEQLEKHLSQFKWEHRGNGAFCAVHKMLAISVIRTGEGWTWWISGDNFLWEHREFENSYQAIRNLKSVLRQLATIGAK